jgi:hypothetical protein
MLDTDDADVHWQRTENGDTSAALNQLQQQAKEATDAAVVQGQQSIEAVKAAGAGYLEQAKALAGNALATAQVSLCPTGPLVE